MGRSGIEKFSLDQLANCGRVVGFVGGGIQTVITTTNLGYFNKDLLAAAKVVDFDG